MKFPCSAVPAVVALALTAACSQSPTGPTPATSGATLGVISQEPPPVPPRANPSIAISAVGATRFVAFGDSITFGTVSMLDGSVFFDTVRSYPERLRLGLNAHHAPQQFTVVNAGNPGEGAVEGATRIASVLSQNPRPQALLLLEGINDLNNGRSVSQTVGALDTILNHARLYNVTVIIATMFQTYEVDTPSGRRTNAADLVPALNDGIRQIAAGRQNVFLVDINHAFGSDRSLVGGDGLHPTDAGYERMATWFEQAIELAFPVHASFQ